MASSTRGQNDPRAHGELDIKPAAGDYQTESSLGFNAVHDLQRRPGNLMGCCQIGNCASPEDFAADLPREQAVFESRSQILTAAKVFTTPMTQAAWKTKPSWAIVAESDRIINPDLEGWYYQRAHSHTIEIKGASHSVYESRPAEVAAQIEAAAQHAQGQ